MKGRKLFSRTSRERTRTLPMRERGDIFGDAKGESIVWDIVVGDANIFKQQHLSFGDNIRDNNDPTKVTGSPIQKILNW